MTQYGVFCCLRFLVYHFLAKGKQWLEATSRVNVGHTLGPKSLVSMATLIRLLLTMAMDIWDRECGPFGPSFAVFATLANLGTPYLHGARDLARMKRAILVAYAQGSIALGFDICSSSLARLMQLAVCPTSPNFALLALFCPAA